MVFKSLVCGSLRYSGKPEQNDIITVYLSNDYSLPDALAAYFWAHDDQVISPETAVLPEERLPFLSAILIFTNLFCKTDAGIYTRAYCAYSAFRWVCESHCDCNLWIESFETEYIAALLQHRFRSDEIS